MGRTTTAIGWYAAAVLMAAAGCSSTDSGVVVVADAQSDAALEPPRVIAGPAVATECEVAGGQCEVGAVCGLVSAGACVPAGAVCCLHVLCAADASVQLIQASDYDQSCAVDSDCVEVPVGNACSCEIGCWTIPAAINKAAMPLYTADVAKSPHVTCGCPPRAPVPFPCCAGGKCQFTGQCSGPIPVVDAAADKGADAATDAVADASASDATDAAGE